ncbi:glycosyltransferase [Lonepinella sp. BR2474]|uniref:glycosyltransferase n=1 Tax=Lonepinella sp. BR2474 TaxID=3434548 RepID=UPI003F6DEA78
MNFVFAADNNYLPHFETVLKSLLCYHENVNIFLFHSEPIDNEFLERIGYCVKQRKGEFFHYFLAPEELSGLKSNEYISSTTYARYFINRLFPYQKSNRWCYLDIDLVVNGDLRHVFDLMQQSEQPALAAIQNADDRLSKMNSPYFNAGVLFLNSDLWQLDEKILLQTTFDNPQYTQGDQDVLNHLIKADYFRLDNRYNYQKLAYIMDMIKFKQGTKTQFHFPKIIHFTGNTKPWQIRNSQIYLGFKNHSEDDGFINNYKSTVFHFANIHRFYENLPWNEILTMPLNYFQPIVKQLFKQNFDYEIQGIADVEILD